LRKTGHLLQDLPYIVAVKWRSCENVNIDVGLRAVREAIAESVDNETDSEKEGNGHKYGKDK